MVKRSQQLVRDPVRREALTHERQRTDGGDEFGFYSVCVPSINFWLGSRPGNDSDMRTPTFCAVTFLSRPQSLR